MHVAIVAIAATQLNWSNPFVTRESMATKVNKINKGTIL